MAPIRPKGCCNQHNCDNAGSKRGLIPIIVLFATLILLTACKVESDPVRTVTIFYTNDEEGYLEPTSDRAKTYGGAANLMAALRRRGYHPDNDKALLLSGGDVWTGPAISTWFQGASTVQVTNGLRRGRSR